MTEYLCGDPHCDAVCELRWGLSAPPGPRPGATCCSVASRPEELGAAGVALAVGSALAAAFGVRGGDAGGPRATAGDWRMAGCAEPTGGPVVGMDFGRGEKPAVAGVGVDR